jgi:hypothetical protein
VWTGAAVCDHRGGPQLGAYFELNVHLQLHAGLRMDICSRRHARPIVDRYDDGTNGQFDDYFAQVFIG